MTERAGIIDGSRYHAAPAAGTCTGTFDGWDGGGAGQWWDTAEEHFEMGLCQAGDLPHLLEQLEVRRLYAPMLMDRAGPGDTDRARRLRDAVAQCGRLGVPKHLAMTESTLARP